MSNEKMSIREKLMNIQNEIKAPKSQKNSFGKYNYRSCEDILEAVKPLLKNHKAIIVISDVIELIGDRYYIKATARIQDIINEDYIENTSYAREELNKKGMDGSQITGASSSYARKYALNGLLLIDDTKDADTDEHKKQQDKPMPKIEQANNGKATKEQIDEIKIYITKYGKDMISPYIPKGTKLTELEKDKMGEILDVLKVSHQKLEPQKQITESGVNNV